MLFSFSVVSVLIQGSSQLTPVLQSAFPGPKLSLSTGGCDDLFPCWGSFENMLLKKKKSPINKGVGSRTRSLLLLGNVRRSGYNCKKNFLKVMNI